MEPKWYYGENNNIDTSYVDKFADSKFGIDKWNSFAREIIQNSLDAVDDEEKPVRIVFDINDKLSLSDIPDGQMIKNVLGKCYEEVCNENGNKNTIKAYQKGLEILSKDKVLCLKISDYNTKGVKSGRDEAWGAFIFDEGKSIKQRPGSAGSHGVGKKVPFLISTCNTVFYATKNKYEKDGKDISDELAQGKTVLIDWKDDEGIRRYHKGWFGIEDKEEKDSTKKIKPIEGEHLDKLNDYFVRKDEYGTDVIIVGVNAYEGIDSIKVGIINAILDNFFVAIKEGKIDIRVFDEEINANTFDDICEKYYDYDQYHAEDIWTPLSEFLDIYNEEQLSTIEIESQGEVIGQAYVYFGLGNSLGRKYFSIIREHGMKIQESRTVADQPFSCFVVVKGERINDLLSDLENAAHNKFVTQDDSMDISEESIAAHNALMKQVKNYIKKRCEIEEEGEQELEGLSDIISIPGQVSSVKKKKHQITPRKNTSFRDGKGKKGKDVEGFGGTGGENGGSKKGKGKAPVSDGGDIKGVLYEEYSVDPVFIKFEGGFLVRFRLNKDINKADFIINSVNVQDKRDDTIGNLIKTAKIENKKIKIKDGKIENLKLKKDILYTLTLKTKTDLVTKLNASLYIKDKEAKGE